MYTNYFIEALRQCPAEQPLLFEGKNIITAGELLQSAAHLAQGLATSGVQRGDKAVLAVAPGVEFLQIIYASMMLRTTLSIIDPEMGRENYLAKLQQFAPDHAFVDSRLVLLNEHPIAKFLLLRLKKTLPSFPRISGCKLFTTGLALPIAQRHIAVRRLIQRRAAPDDIHTFQTANDTDDFLITYTSGTLSEPKGVVHSYASLMNSICYLTDMLREHQDEVIATHLPHFALLGISAGMRVHLWDYRQSAAEKIAFIERHGITTLFGPPSDYLPLMEYLNRRQQSFPACLKNIYLGSAPIYPPFLERILRLSHTLRITCLYGMTENLMVARQDGRAKLQAAAHGDLVGTPFPNVQVHIAEDGEIWLRSDQLYTRYWHMTGEPVQEHATGDLGMLDEQGRIVLLGRKKDMMIRGNFNLYPALYEPTIMKIEGVKEAVMIGRYRHDRADEEIVLVIDGDKSLTEASIRKQLTSGKCSIDKEALPDRIVFMEIPHSGRQNKIDRKTLAQRLSGD